MGLAVENCGIVFEGDGAALVVGRGRFSLRPRRGCPRLPFHWSSEGWSDLQTTRAVLAAARAGGHGPILAALPAADRAWLATLPADLAADVLEGVCSAAAQMG